MERTRVSTTAFVTMLYCRCCNYFLLFAASAAGTSDCPVRIKLIAPPMYVMTCMTLDKEAGLEVMNQAIEAIAACIRSKG